MGVNGRGEAGAGGMTDDEIRSRLAQRQTEHRDLDAAIHALALNPSGDMLAIARLKKRKLLIKDEIVWLEDQLLPDIIA